MGQAVSDFLGVYAPWLGSNNDAIMTVLLLVFGVVLLANGLAPLTDGS